MPTFPSGDVTLHYQITGLGEPVVLLHGLGSSGEDWEPQVSALAADYQVITIDFRGHGASERGSAPYSIPQFADDVATLLTALELPAAHVVGISLGGMVAFQLAADHAPQVRSLVIINSGPAYPGRTLKGKLALWTRLLILRLKGLEALGPVVAGKLFPNPEQASLRAEFARRFVRNDQQAYERTLHAIGRFDVSAQVRRLTMPVLVLSGDRDYTPVAAKEAYVRQLPNATLEVIEDSGHASPIDQAEAVNASLRRFFSRA
jgi:pimeloyl-ACP methyl ester carboxylesterase